MTGVADSGGAEADQRFAIVGGVALEVAPQLSRSLRPREIVVGQRKMIQPDLDVARGSERFGYGLRLLHASDAVRQGRFLDHALMLLERRHMSVAEHSKPVRPHGGCGPGRVGTGSDRLVR